MSVSIEELARAPELADYQDEPAQLPVGAAGKDGFLRMEFVWRDGRTILSASQHRAPLAAHRALYWDESLPSMACVFIISVGGSLVQGDRLQIELALGPGAQAHVTNQAATCIYSMNANYAAQAQRISLEDNAYLEYLPDMIIPHKHSRFITHTLVTAAPSATMLYSEILMPGRKHMGGEVFQYDVFSSELSARRPDGTELFTEKFIIQPRQMDVRRVGVMGEFDVFGNVLLLADRQLTDQVLWEAPTGFQPERGWAAGASRLPYDAGLIYKILGHESAVVVDKVREFATLVRREKFGIDRPIRRPF